MASPVSSRHYTIEDCDFLLRQNKGDSKLVEKAREALKNLERERKVHPKKPQAKANHNRKLKVLREEVKDRANYIFEVMGKDVDDDFELVNPADSKEEEADVSSGFCSIA